MTVFDTRNGWNLSNAGIASLNITAYLNMLNTAGFWSGVYGVQHFPMSDC